MPRSSYDDEVEPREARRSERSELMEAVDLLGRRLGGALVLAGLLIGVGVYWSGDRVEAPTYQAFSANGEVFRVNMDSGTVIACNSERCMRVLDSDRDVADQADDSLFRVRVEGSTGEKAAPQQIAPPVQQPQLPAPAPAQPQPAQPQVQPQR